MSEPIRTSKGKLPRRGKHDARLGRVVQVLVTKKGRRVFGHLSSAGKQSSLTMMKWHRRGQEKKRTGAKRMHIAGIPYDTGHGGSKATSKRQ